MWNTEGLCQNTDGFLIRITSRSDLGFKKHPGYCVRTDVGQREYKKEEACLIKIAERFCKWLILRSGMGHERETVRSAFSYYKSFQATFFFPTVYVFW